jgi:hypothetical protein
LQVALKGICGDLTYGEEKANIDRRMLFEISPASRLVGIAGFANQSGLLETKRRRYFEMKHPVPVQAGNAIHVDYQSVPGLRIRL